MSVFECVLNLVNRKKEKVFKEHFCDVGNYGPLMLLLL